MTILATTLLVLFLRRPDAFLYPQFWAEDFTFLIGAEKSGVAAFWTPQAGYLHLIPRTIAWCGHFLDPVLQPGFFLFGWLLVLFAVIFTCFSTRLELPRKSWLAAAVLLVPHSGEVFFNPTNAQWIAALGLLLVLLKRDPAGFGDWLADAGLLLFSGLSGPFVILALPLFLWRAGRRRSASSWIICAIAIVFAAVQGWFIAHSPPDREFVGPFSLLDLVANVAFRLPGNLFFGLLPAAGGKVVSIAVGAAVLGVIGVAVSRAKAHRPAAVRLLVFIAVLLTATTIRKRFDLWGFGDIDNGDRYFFIPKVLLLWVTVLAFASQPSRRLRRILGALLACALLINAPRFPFLPLHHYAWYAHAPEIRAGHEVELTINPDWKFRYRRGSLQSRGPYW